MMRITAVVASSLALALAIGAQPAGAAGFDVDAPVFGKPHHVSYDRYSLMIDGRRLAIWSGEFHLFRLPSQKLWMDVLQKLRAGGFNTVSLYFSWAYSSPAPGVYDFGGVRNIARPLHQRRA
jgi:hypothetical protein